jgi:hypothetical protein
MAKRHKDLEFQLEDAGGSTRTLNTFDEACGLAVSIAASTGREVTIDVLAGSKAAARVWAGDYGVEVYEEDPEASVHERIVVKAESQGRIA